MNLYYRADQQLYKSFDNQRYEQVVSEGFVDFLNPFSLLVNFENFHKQTEDS